MSMIKCLMDQEYPFGGEENNRLAKEADAIFTALKARLDEGGKKLLEELVDLDIQRIVAVQEDAFEMGVCTGIRLMCEVQSHD